MQWIEIKDGKECKKAYDALVNGIGEKAYICNNCN